MAYDRGKLLQGYSEFYRTQIVTEKDISRTNLKLSKIVSEAIKYEYFLNEGVLSSEDAELILPQSGLFSGDKIMAYVFVFDYNDDKSLEDMRELAMSIYQSDQTRASSESGYTKSVICFIANKYSNFLTDKMIIRKGNKLLHKIYNQDEKACEILKKLKMFYEDEEKAKDCIFFVNAKYNIGVNNAFDSVINNINQIDALWRRVRYEADMPYDPDAVSESGKKSNNNGGFNFLCCGTRKKEEPINSQKEKVVILETGGNLKFKVEDEESDYDKNYSFLVVKKKTEDNNDIQITCENLDTEDGVRQAQKRCGIF